MFRVKFFLQVLSSIRHLCDTEPEERSSRCDSVVRTKNYKHSNTTYYQILSQTSAQIVYLLSIAYFALCGGKYKVKQFRPGVLLPNTYICQVD
jgi:hypothetical protein